MVASNSADARVHRAHQRRAGVRFAGHHHAPGLHPIAVHAHAEAGGRALDRLRARVADFDFAANRRRDRVHHLPQPALERAEQRGRGLPRDRVLAARARSASTPRVRLPYRLASSTKRGNTLVTLSAAGLPP